MSNEDVKELVNIKDAVYSKFILIFPNEVVSTMLEIKRQKSQSKSDPDHIKI